jgi:hypothetical protein
MVARFFNIMLQRENENTNKKQYFCHSFALRMLIEAHVPQVLCWLLQCNTIVD